MAVPATAASLGRGRPSGRARLLVERNLMVYRHTWTVLLAEVVEPLLYLLSIGFGIGMLIGDVPGLDSGSISYPEFVAPALLATASMNSAMNETTFAMFHKLRVDRVYDALLTTPLTVRDMVLGEVLWAVLRAVIACTGFLAIVSAVGLVHSAWALLVIPAAGVIGFAFAAVGAAVTTYLRTSQDFQLIQLVMLPMFLFATTFYPLSVYAEPVQVLVACLPLYQSIELIRDPALGQVGIGLLGPATYLVVLGGLALWIAVGRLERALLR